MKFGANPRAQRDIGKSRILCFDCIMLLAQTRISTLRPAADPMLCRFEIMHERIYKLTHVSNIIIRVSDGTPEGKQHAVLVNSHLDSTLPTPGAADDALAVGVMLDVLRVLVNTPKWSPKHAIIFCRFSSMSSESLV